MDGVKLALGREGMTVEAVQSIARSEETWWICSH